MKVLVIAWYFPPAFAIGAVRTAKLVEALHRHGDDVRVLAPVIESPELEMDSGYVVRTPWWDVRTMKRHDLKSGEAGVAATERSLHSASYRYSNGAGARVRRLGGLVRREIVEVPDSMVGWIPGALSAGTSLIEGWRPDVVYVSGPPFSGFLIAKRLAQMASCPWIADYRDAWTSGGYYAQSRVRRTLDRAIEKRVVRTSAAVVTVSDPLATEISDVLGVPVESIPNGFDGVTLPSARDRIPLSGATLNLLYVGNNLYEGRRSPAPLLLGARRLGLSAEDVKFHFLGTDPHLVEQVAKATSSSDLVQVWPGTAHEESVAMQSRADVLMLLLWNSPLEAGTYSGKLFEYLAVGRPIVMSGYPHGVAAQLIQSRSLGAIVNTPSDAEIWLRDALRSKGGKSLLNADLPAENRRGLSREERNAEMIALLRSVVDGRG